MAVMLLGQVTLACVSDGLSRCITSLLPLIYSLKVFSIFFFNTNLDSSMNSSELCFETFQ